MGFQCTLMSDVLCNLGLHGWSYHAIHGLWLCLLGLDVHRRDQDVLKGWLPPGELEAGQ